MRPQMHPAFYTKDNVPEEFKDVIGDYTYGNPEISGHGAENLSIGKFCSIAGDVKILVGGGHNYSNFSQYPFDSLRNEQGETVWPFTKEATPPIEARGVKTGVRIGNDVWIGCRATILPGTVIGDGAVIGAGSVVAGYIPSYTVAVGNPAKVIKDRFTPDIVSALLRIQWWNWDDEQILSALPTLENVYEFIQKYDTKAENLSHNHMP